MSFSVTGPIKPIPGVRLARQQTITWSRGQLASDDQKFARYVTFSMLMLGQYGPVMGPTATSDHIKSGAITLHYLVEEIFADAIVTGDRPDMGHDPATSYS